MQSWLGTGRLTADATFIAGSEPSKNRAVFAMAVPKERDSTKSDFFNVTTFGPRADYVRRGMESGRYLKGCKVEVRGSIELYKYKKRNGEDDAIMQVIAEYTHSEKSAAFANQAPQAPAPQGNGPVPYGNTPAMQGAPRPQGAPNGRQAYGNPQGNSNTPPASSYTQPSSPAPAAQRTQAPNTGYGRTDYGNGRPASVPTGPSPYGQQAPRTGYGQGNYGNTQDASPQPERSYDHPYYGDSQNTHGTGSTTAGNSASGHTSNGGIPEGGFFPAEVNIFAIENSSMDEEAAAETQSVDGNTREVKNQETVDLSDGSQMQYYVVSNSEPNMSYYTYVGLIQKDTAVIKFYVVSTADNADYKTIYTELANSTTVETGESDSTGDATEQTDPAAQTEPQS